MIVLLICVTSQGMATDMKITIECKPKKDDPRKANLRRAVIIKETKRIKSIHIILEEQFDRAPQNIWDRVQKCFPSS